MGISEKNFDFMTKSFKKIFPNGDINNKLMLELGNQRIRKKIRKNFNIKYNISKQYFESLGVKHYSIDINGKEGSIPIDLSKPITDKFWHNKFDIGTDFGTIEHITNKNFGQWQAWCNFHNAIKKGGIFIHSIPHKNGWIKHCDAHYDNEFFEKLSETNNYRIIYNKLTKKELIHACLIKESDNNFMEDKELFTSWIHFKKNENEHKYS